MYKLWSFSLCSLLQPPSTSSLLGPNILLSTLNLCSYLSVRDQVSHPYKTKGEITILYILILKFLERIQDNKIFWIESQAFPNHLLNHIASVTQDDYYFFMLCYTFGAPKFAAPMPYNL
jgi:hypothetical protein